MCCDDDYFHHAHGVTVFYGGFHHARLMINIVFF